MESLTNNPKHFWSHPKPLKSNLNSDTLNAISPNSWVEHFSKLFHSENTQDESSSTKYIINGVDSVLNSPLTAEEISNGIKQLKNNKASDHDFISNEMVELAAPTMLPFLTIQFNKILETKEYPDVWSIGIITLILKSGEVNNPDNYRGITITSCLGKLFNLLLTTRLTKYVNDKRLINYSQVVFRKGVRTADHVFTVKTLIDKCLSQNRKLYFCFVDFRKAYDSTWRKCLFQKLISSSFVKLLVNMYYKTKLSIRLPRAITNFLSSSIGLKQGCNLSPILFNLFINIHRIFDKTFCQPPRLLNIQLNYLL